MSKINDRVLDTFRRGADTPAVGQRVLENFKKETKRPKPLSRGVQLLYDFGKYATPKPDKVRPIDVIRELPGAVGKISETVIGSGAQAFGSLFGFIAGKTKEEIRQTKQIIKGERKVLDYDPVSVYKEAVKYAKESGKQARKTGEAFTPIIAATAIPGVGPIIAGSVGMYITGKGVYDIAKEFGTISENRKLYGQENPNLVAAESAIRKGGQEGWKLIGLNDKEAKEVASTDWGAAFGNFFLFSPAIFGGRRGVKRTARSVERAGKVLTQKIVTEYGTPRYLEIEAKDVWDWQTGADKISPEVSAALNQANLPPAARINAVRNGVKLRLPIEKITKIIDRPWWKQVKGLFKIPPKERIVATEQLGMEQAPVALLETPSLTERFMRQEGFAQLPAYRGEKDITTNVLKELEGRSLVSKQFIANLAMRPELRQAERDLIKETLEEFDDKIPVKEFADKIKTKLLPLKRIEPRGNIEYKKNNYEFISLPPKLRGKIAKYSEHIYESPIRTVAGAIHFVDTTDDYFAHTRVEDLPNNVTRRVIELQSDLFQKGQLEKEFSIGSQYIWDDDNIELFYDREGVNNDFVWSLWNVQKRGSGNLFNAVKGLLNKRPVLLTTGERRMWREKFSKIADIKNDEERWAIEDKIIPQFLDLVIKERAKIDSAFRKALREVKREIQEKNITRTREYTQLKPYRNTWYERIIREEIKRAAQDGKTKLQFPTGETAMKIERLGDRDVFRIRLREGGGISRIAGISDLKVGKEVLRGGEGWIITDILGDGKFKAVPVNIKDKALPEFRKSIDDMFEGLKQGKKIPQTVKRDHIAFLRQAEETFDISGKVDTSNPIYKFYEKNVQKSLKRIRPDMRRIRDPQGVEWFEIDIRPEDVKKPIVAFKTGDNEPPLNMTEKEAYDFLRKIFPEKHAKFLALGVEYETVNGVPSRVWGKYANEMMYVYQKNGKVNDRTVYHESFHQYLDLFMNEKAKRELLADVAKRHAGTLGQKMKSGVRYGPEEFLADAFAEYVSGKKTFSEKIKALFQQIIRHIRQWLGKENKVLDLFDEILSGEAKGVPEKQEPVQILQQLIRQAKPKRGRLESLYTEERARRFAEVEALIDKAKGKEDYAKVLRALKGELVPEGTIRFEPLEGKLSQEHLDNLYLMTWRHPYLNLGEKVNTANALTNLLVGKIPQPKQIELLEEVYGSELVKSILKKRALGVKMTDFAIDLANVPRALLATADMSAFLRQGIVTTMSHPILSAKAMVKTFQFAFSPKVFDKFFKDLEKDPLYPLMRKSKLAITDPKKSQIQYREEAFMSQLLQKLPLIGHIIRFSERAYVGFLNKMRTDLFRQWADEFLSEGLSPVKDKEIFQAAADVVNTFTGRGSMGRLNSMAPILNTLFFSPRLITARFNALNPVWYAKMPKKVRKKAIGDFAKFVLTGLSILSLLKLWKGDEIDVEADPRSADFGKIRVGNTRFDIWGGFQQWVRVFAQLTTGERKLSTTGEIISLTKDEYPFTTRKETLQRFIEGKLAPVPSLMNELISGAKTMHGEDITLGYVTKNRLIPLYIQDITETYRDGGLGRAATAAGAAFFGVGVQTYDTSQIRLSDEEINIRYKINLAKRRHFEEEEVREFSRLVNKAKEEGIIDDEQALKYAENFTNNRYEYEAVQLYSELEGELPPPGTPRRIVEEYSKLKLEKMREDAFQVTEQEKYKVIATIFGESLGEPEEGTQAVVNVIVNRALDEEKTVFDIISAPAQFSAYSVDNKLYMRALDFLRGKDVELSRDERLKINLIRRLLRDAENGKLKDITNGALFFHNPDIVNPPYYEGKGKKVGGHVFY